MGRTRTRTAPGITLGADSLFALDRGDKWMIALLDRALAQGRAFRVPSGVLGQAWSNGRVQVKEVEIVPLNGQLAFVWGTLRSYQHGEYYDSRRGAATLYCDKRSE